MATPVFDFGIEGGNVEFGYLCLGFEGNVYAAPHCEWFNFGREDHMVVYVDERFEYPRLCVRCQREDGEIDECSLFLFREGNDELTRELIDMIVDHASRWMDETWGESILNSLFYRDGANAIASSSTAPSCECTV